MKRMRTKKRTKKMMMRRRQWRAARCEGCERWRIEAEGVARELAGATGRARPSQGKIAHDRAKQKMKRRRKKKKRQGR
jgi:hypothetical protein